MKITIFYIFDLITHSQTCVSEYHHKTSNSKYSLLYIWEWCYVNKFCVYIRHIKLFHDPVNASRSKFVRCSFTESNSHKIFATKGELSAVTAK